VVITLGHPCKADTGLILSIIDNMLLRLKFYLKQFILLLFVYIFQIIRIP
jgi:hypothetical protein